VPEAQSGRGAMFLLGYVVDDDDLNSVAAQAAYLVVLRNLVFFKQKLAKSYGPRRTGLIDEIVLHGTESKGTQEQSATFLQSVHGIHYFIGRDSGLAYRIVPDEYQSRHAGNPNGWPTVQNHNPRSIGIEMYQKDISLFKNDASKLDFTDWQYQTVAMLCYHICHRWTIARTNIVGHGKINPKDRSPNEPRNFDWDHFNQNLDNISRSLVALLGNDFALPR
jgi:N-acetyl-anhydromuramyl-L-alanine amidase AmpD